MEYWEAISDAISKLRERKNRPDSDNIYTFLMRKKVKLTRLAFERALEELEKEKKLYRSCFKGHISYRQTHPGEKAITSFSSDTEEDTQDTTEAFGRPVANEEKGDNGAENPTTEKINNIEMAAKTDGAGSCPGSTVSSDSDSQDASSKKRKFSIDASSGPVARVSSRKRTKKTHGPDWQTDVPQLECKVHLSTCVVCKSKDISSNLLQCSACKIYVHARCLQLTERSVAKISANKQFYCLRCKPCKICHYEASTDTASKDRCKMTLPSIMAGNDIIHCCQCYSVFHLKCLRPPLTTKPKDSPWMCRKCNYEVNKKEKLKAAAAANAMIAMVSQQKPMPNGERSDSSKSSRSSSSSPVSNNENSLGNNVGPPSVADSPDSNAIKTEEELKTPDKKEPALITENNNSNSATNNNALPQNTKPKNTDLKNSSELRRKLLEIIPPSNHQEESPARPPAPTENKVTGNKRTKVPRMVNETPKSQSQQQSNKQAAAVACQAPQATLRTKDSQSNGVAAVAKKSSVKTAPEPSLVLTAAEPISNGQPTILGQVLIPIPIAARPKSPPLLVAKKGFAQFQIDYPFVGEWTSEQVANFFKALGYDKEAPVFVEQEIDGRSLLLLGRNDVLNGLGLKLGPAVKIFKHISNLQGVEKID